MDRLDELENNKSVIEVFKIGGSIVKTNWYKYLGMAFLLYIYSRASVYMIPLMGMNQLLTMFISIINMIIVYSVVIAYNVIAYNSLMEDDSIGYLATIKEKLFPLILTTFILGLLLTLICIPGIFLFVLTGVSELQSDIQNILFGILGLLILIFSLRILPFMNLVTLSDKKYMNAIKWTFKSTKDLSGKLFLMYIFVFPIAFTNKLLSQLLSGNIIIISICSLVMNLINGWFNTSLSVFYIYYLMPSLNNEEKREMTLDEDSLEY